MTRDDDEMHYVTVEAQIDTTTPEGVEQLKQLCEREQLKTGDDTKPSNAEFVAEYPRNGSAGGEHNVDPEVQRHIVAALNKIEAAQHLLESACADHLSVLEGAIPLWRRTGKLADDAHNLWRRLCYGATNKWRVGR